MADTGYVRIDWLYTLGVDELPYCLARSISRQIEGAHTCLGNSIFLQYMDLAGVFGPSRNPRQYLCTWLISSLLQSDGRESPWGGIFNKWQHLSSGILFSQRDLSWLGNFNKKFSEGNRKEKVCDIYFIQKVLAGYAVDWDSLVVFCSSRGLEKRCWAHLCYLICKICYTQLSCETLGYRRPATNCVLFCNLTQYAS